MQCCVMVVFQRKIIYMGSQPIAPPLEFLLN